MGVLSRYGAAGRWHAGAGGGPQALAAVTAKKLYAVIALDFGADIAQNIGELKRLIADPNALGKQLTTPVKFYLK